MNAPESFDIFLSYTDEEQAVELHTFLTDLGYKVWLDLIEVAAGKFMFDAIADGIQNSKLFMCCVNTEYTKSRVRKSELGFAYNLEKPIIPIMLEDLKLTTLGGLGFCLNRAVRVRLFEYTIRGWSKDHSPGKLIIQAINAALVEYNPPQPPQQMFNSKKHEIASLQVRLGIEDEYSVVGDNDDDETYKVSFRGKLSSKPKDKGIHKLSLPLKASKILRDRMQSSVKTVFEKVVVEEKQKSLPEVKKQVKFSENLFTVFDIERWINNDESEPVIGSNDAEMDSAAEERFQYWQLRWKTHRPFPQSGRFVSSVKSSCSEDNNLKINNRRTVRRLVANPRDHYCAKTKIFERDNKLGSMPS